MYTFVSIIIRDVDKELYAKIKSYAGARGIKIGQILDEAMRDWLKKQENTNITEESIQNEIAYRQAKNSLEKDHMGKWVLICQGQLMCKKKTLKEIIDYKSELKIGDKPALVYKIGTKSREVFLNVIRR